jgi:hypothetical protein
MRLQSAVRSTARSSRLAAAACIGLCAFSAAAFAQTQPMPALPPEPQGTADPAGASPAVAAGDKGDVTIAGSAARPQPWEYGFGLGAGWDSNISFRVPDGPSSAAITPRANLAHVFWGPKGELRLGGTGYWIGYVDEKDQSRYDATFSLDGTYRSSLDTTWRASASYSYGYSDSSTVLADQGVLLPVVPAQTAAVGLGVTRRLGTRTSFRLDGRGYSTLFEQADAVASGLVDGRSVRGTAALDWKVGSRNTAGIVYSLEGVFHRPPEAPGDERTDSYLTHYLSLQWSHVLSPRSAFLLEGGSSYTPDSTQAGLAQPWSFYGGASYNRKVKRSSVQLFARREVTPAFGLGVSRLENRFGLTAAIPMGRSWTLAFGGTHVLPETPEGASFSYSTPDEAYADLGVRIGRVLEISAEGRYRRRSATPSVPAIEGFQAGLFISLLSPNSRTATRILSR